MDFFSKVLIKNQKVLFYIEFEITYAFLLGILSIKEKKMKKRSKRGRKYLCRTLKELKK